MAESLSDESPARTRPGPNPDSSVYWCYHCDKRVAIETLADLPNDVVCYECKNGFIESVSSSAIGEPTLDHQFLHMLRLIAREEHAPMPPPSDLSDEDFLGLDLDAWNNEIEDDEADRSFSIAHEEEEEDDNDEEQSEISGSDIEEEEENEAIDDVEEESENEAIGDIEDEDENEAIDERGGEIEEEEEDEQMSRSRRDVLRHRLRELVRDATRHRRILDWAEVLMDLEDLSIDLRLQVPESSDNYVGNPGDYVDAAGYEALLQNLADSDTGGRRGAPPAAKAAVEGLESVVIGRTTTTTCAICRDMVNVGEVAKRLPCGHEFHGECIVPWLSTRNSCPVCRFELPTDDPEYEEEKRRRAVAVATSLSGDGDGDSGLE